MSRLTWDAAFDRRFETGIRKGVLYVQFSTGGYKPGVAWNGLTAVTESPSGADITDLYADDIKYASYRAVETFGATIEAYTYPAVFEQCDGMAEAVNGVLIGQQERRRFGLCYQTQIGHAGNQEAGYKLHIIYGASASPSEKSYQTINESPDIGTFSWEISTIPVSSNTGLFKPTSIITIDSTRADETRLGQLEDILYGTASEAARLPLPDEVMSTMGFVANNYTDGTSQGVYHETQNLEDPNP